MKTSIIIKDHIKGSYNGKLFNDHYLPRIPAKLLNLLIQELEKSKSDSVTVPQDEIFLAIYGNSTYDSYRRKSLSVMICQFVNPVAEKLGYKIKSVRMVGIKIFRLNLPNNS